MRRILLSSAIIGLSCALPASATTITAWNLDNVAPGPVPVADGDTEVSLIFEDATSPVSNGQIAYTAPEAVTPGLIALNDPYTSGQGTFDGCIRADVGGTECATGFRTGNRFKLQLTEAAPVDLVFNIDPDAAGTQGGLNDDGSIATPGINTYQVFGRAVNLTQELLEGFTVQLGFGLGEDFVQSTDGDGLGLALGLELGPTNAPVFTQFPFGLFGDADFNNRFDLDGFFNDGRSGFDVSFGEDLIESTGLYESVLSEMDSGLSYKDLFGGTWISREMAPAGLLWDNDADPTTDALVVAYQLEDGTWVALRDIDTLPVFDADGNLVTAGTAVSILGTPEPFATQAEAEKYFTDQGALIDYEVNIEDLANLNLNFGIELADSFIGWGENFQNKNFTLRIAAISAVPLPTGAPLLLAGLAVLGFIRKRQLA